MLYNSFLYVLHLLFVEIQYNTYLHGFKTLSNYIYLYYILWLSYSSFSSKDLITTSSISSFQIWFNSASILFQNSYAETEAPTAHLSWLLASCKHVQSNILLQVSFFAAYIAVQP